MICEYFFSVNKNGYVTAIVLLGTVKNFKLCGLQPLLKGELGEWDSCAILWQAESEGKGRYGP